jgi:hypothetical protein
MPIRASIRPIRPIRPIRAPLLLLAFAALGATAIGCSRHDADEAEDAGAEAIDASDFGTRGRLDASAGDAADAAPYDARAAQEQAAIADAGRFCGDKDLPNCPLQEWMKRNAKTMIGFGDISSIAEVFDRIPDFAPTATTEDGGLVYASWVSIAHDGAAAARAGNLNAAKAACRGCHRQYRATYHAWLRGRPLPPEP